MRTLPGYSEMIKLPEYEYLIFMKHLIEINSTLCECIIDFQKKLNNIKFFMSISFKDMEKFNEYLLC